MDPVSPLLRSYSPYRAFLLPSYPQVVLTVLPSPSQGQCLVGGGTSLVSLASTTPMVAIEFLKTLQCIEALDSKLIKGIFFFVFTDRWFPALLKSLRSQRVIYVSCGEDHTAALTKVCDKLSGQWLQCVLYGSEELFLNNHAPWDATCKTFMKPVSLT